MNRYCLGLGIDLKYWYRHHRTQIFYGLDQFFRFLLKLYTLSFGGFEFFELVTNLWQELSYCHGKLIVHSETLINVTQLLASMGDNSEEILLESLEAQMLHILLAILD